MTDTLNPPVGKIAVNKLWVSCQKVEWQVYLAGVKFSYEVKKALPNPYALIIRQDHQAGNTIIVAFHAYVSNCDKGNRFLAVLRNITAHSSTKPFSVQIVMLPKHLPHG